MKKIILIATCAASIPAYGLPTYEPFTEYASKIASQNSTYVALSNGIPFGTNASGSVSHAIDLATNELTAPGGETWASLSFNGTAGTGLTGLDVCVVSNTTIFPFSALTNLLPNNFPGKPVSGQAITNIVENPAQPLIWSLTATNSSSTNYVPSPNIVGNSAVLIFANDITRPASGIQTLFVSYLFDVAQMGQLGAGNTGRYLDFVASSNLVEGAGSGGFYQTWTNMFNFPGATTRYANTPNYFGHGLLSHAANSSYYVSPTDSSAGKVPSAFPTTFSESYNAACFIVGEFILVSTNASLAGVQDTNIVWVNPATNKFGGPIPLGGPAITNLLAVTMSDVNGLVIEDRVGSGAAGGVGTNYIANLMLGSTWSYVTGGPEFTTQPAANTYVYSYANNVVLTGVATAAGQSVTYHWQKVTGGVTNTLTDGSGTAGGTASVTGSGTSTLTLSGESLGDMGTYQVVATASGTGYTLTTQSIVANVTDPFINPQPQPVTVNEGGTASFSSAAVASTGPITYQWYNGTTPLTNGTQLDNSTISGANGTVAGTSLSTTLTLTGLTYQERGNYILWVTNGSGAFISSTAAALTVIDPYFTKQPTSSFTANAGTATNFTAVATGSGTVTYQWYNQSGPLSISGDISGVTTTNLTFSSLQPSDTGTYYLVATGSGGSTQSSNLVISVLPIIVQPPNNVIVATGGSNNITVGTFGSGLSYQWYSVSSGQLNNTGDFSGVTTSNLTIVNAQSGDTGIYYVVVSWGATNSEQSANANIFVENSSLGPFPPTNLPPTVAASSQVDYVILDANSGSDTPGFTIPAGWNNNLSLPASGGDQTYATGTTYNGLQGDTFTGTYVNPIDPNWRRFASYPVIDVLLQVYGNSDMYNATNGGLPTTWTEGQLNSPPDYVHEGTFPLSANNGQWNWMLLEVTNPVNPATGSRFVGDTTPSVQSSGGTAGGINNGTIRLEGWTSGLTIRTIALGPQGVFGTTNEINRFAVPSNCAPEPATNLVYVDFNQGITNNLTVNNNGSFETYQVVSGVGPTGDKRTAIQATSEFMEFPILNNTLGLPCNGDFTMQLCIEFYDDPNLAGTQFGPYAFATDPQGDIGYVPGYPNAYNQAYYTMTGSGQWLKVDWFVGPANLAGLYVAPLTGGPLVDWGTGATPYVDRIELGLVQTGTNALAGQIPDPSYNLDPFVCSSTSNSVGYYAEWDPTDGVLNNLTTATAYTTTVTGPANDQRTAEVPSPSGGGAYYEQFKLLNNPFGPVLQDNADVAMLVTYYDDPARASNTFFVNTITTMTDGNLGVVSPSGSNTLVTLQGTGKWVDAYFEVPNVNFAATASFSATPDFVCRYASSAPIYISRVRYNVIRSCGQYEGIDYLQGIVGITKTNSGAVLNWRGSASLLGSTAVQGTYTNVVAVTNDVINNYTVPTANAAEFFKLQFPSYPTNLSTNTPAP